MRKLSTTVVFLGALLTCGGALALPGADAAPNHPADAAALGAESPERPALAPTAAADAAVARAASDPIGVVGELIKTARTGHIRMAAALALSLLMFAWNWARKNIGWLKKRMSGDRAGAISLIGLAVAGGVLSALVVDSPLDVKLVVGSVWTAVDAAGLFLLVKRIFKSKPEETAAA